MRRLIALIAGAGSAAALTLAPAVAGAATAHRVPRPDLKVTRLELDGVGDPPHMLVSHDGTVPRLGISVTTTNDGKAAAGPSTTLIMIDDGGEVPVQRQVHVGRLAPGASEHKSIQVTGLKPELGFTEVSAHADWLRVVRESDEQNNGKSAPKVAVEALEWDVTTLETIGTGPGVLHTTKAVQDFRFRFEDWDKGFFYKAIGPVEDIPKEMGTCTTSQTKTASRDPWANSGMRIAPDLKHYKARVTTSPIHYKVTYNCDGSPIQAETVFLDLATFIGVGLQPKMAPDAKELHGKGERSAGQITDKWRWDFKAAIK